MRWPTGFLANHARAAALHNPPPEGAAGLSITERSAQGIVAGPAEASYMVKQKSGRRDRCRGQAHPAACRAGLA